MMYGSPDGVRYCHRVTPMLFDYTTGHAICTDCVLVLGNFYANRAAAAAKYVDGADDSNNRGRATDVGNGAAPLPPDSEVAAADDAGSAAPRMRGAVSDTSKALAEGFDAIANMATQLGLADTVINRGKDVLRNGAATRSTRRGLAADAQGAHHGDARRRGGGQEGHGKLLHYGSAVGMSEQEVSEPRRATRSCGIKSVREVSAATGVSVSTIKEAYKDLRPHAALLFGENHTATQHETAY
uniref:TFIIB-type domain-containing protein n=1 Tax=Leersia perrieri TaxID=77586 RepID=A0A0D9WYF6_9ORYZ